ncbi:MAG TPA: helix-hairpin-helix domain-containing protein [Acidiferrobacteraceae bacterium]|nr:helix-hairpin-helix domain-containing protein [Acidiferrobacteraceae bacterium]
MKTLRALFVVLLLGIFSSISYAAPVNINTADTVALAEALNGVGPKIAAAIIEYREKHGPFQKVEDLVSVKGIGPKILEKNRKDILLANPEKRAKK